MANSLQPSDRMPAKLSASETPVEQREAAGRKPKADGGQSPDLLTTAGFGRAGWSDFGRLRLFSSASEPRSALMAASLVRG